MDWKKVGRRVLAALALLCIAAAVSAQVPASQRVVLVIDENSSFSDVMSNMPWLVGLGNANGYANNYESDNGGSLLDYLWLASGSCESAAQCTLPAGTHDFYCNGNDCYYPNTTTTDPITDDNIFREMNKAGISWKVYAQSYAAAGGTPSTPDNNNGTSYYRRHNGAVWYSDILSNVDGSASHIVDLSQLTTDLNHGTLPRFMIIVPDGNHDAHDCPVGMSTCTEAQQLAAADAFLQSTVGPLLNTADFKKGGSGLFIVTFDECGGGTDAGCGAAVYTALIGPKVTPHTVSSIPYKHENALRTMLDGLGIKTYPGASATAAPMSDFFGGETSELHVVVHSPKNKANVGSPVTFEASATPSSGHTITGWKVYVDSVSDYTGGATTSISPSIAMSDASHNVVIRAWDTSGAYADQSLTVTVSAKTKNPKIRILTPSEGQTLGSPVNVRASVSPGAGKKITKWAIYVDGSATFHAGAVETINAKLPMSNGTHKVAIRAWDASGDYGDEILSVNVVNKPTVELAKPERFSRVMSPIKVWAAGRPTSGHHLTGWWVYLDSVGAYEAGSVGSIKADIHASAGKHTLVVRTWDSSGAYGDQTFVVYVKKKPR